MTGARSLRLKHRLAGASAAALLGLSFACAYAIGSAEADKVGVAAAVNPDAFSSLSGSPQTQLSIGKSIFFNERINTTGSGLVQVLLVDGSTFTVGPGSDLVIDKFVYDPKKGTGQIAASFSKGVMRFVGGKISKQEGGVTVDTPSGALAIRGCIVQGTPNKMSFLFGVSMSWKGNNGQTANVYQPGYTLDLTAGTPNVRPTTTADINAVMAGLTNGNSNGLGTSGTTGEGGPDQALQEANQASQTADSLINAANQTQIQGEIQNQLNNQPTGAPPGGAPPDEVPPPETVTLPTTLTMHVLTAPDYYVANKKSFWSPGVFIVDPGAHGILGGDDQKIPCFLSPSVCNDSYHGTFEVGTDDFNVESTLIANGRIQGTVPSVIERTGFNWWGPTYGKTPGGTFDLPIFDVVGVHPVTDAVAVDELDGELRTTHLVGSAFTGKGGGFFAYQLFEANLENNVWVADLDKPVLAFGGTPYLPTTTQDQLRLFNLFTDPRQNIAAPFASAQTSPSVLSQPGAGGATIQPLYLLEDSSVDGHSVWVQTSFLISGEGTEQQSILVLALGEQNQETGQLEGLRRGMSHAEFFVPNQVEGGTPTSLGIKTFNLTGSIATLAGADAETYLFGNTIPHFVIGADSTGNGHNIFQDQPLPTAGRQALSSEGLYNNAPSSQFLGATYHIGEQVAQTNAPAPVTTDPDGLDFYGYAAGIYEQTTDNLNINAFDEEGGDSELPVGILANTQSSDVHLKFKTDHRLSALFNLSGAGDNQGGGASLAFGDWGSAHGRSAVINGDIYAAVESATQKSTVTVEGYNGYHYNTPADASLYLVSSNLLGNTGKVELCTGCNNFMKWGTWGGQVQFKDGWTPVTADVNLGWYVVGNITTDTQLNSYTTWLATGPSANYTGTAIGNVANNIDGSGWKTYVATGDLAMNWNFAGHTGNLTISKFDTSVTPGPNPTGLTFSGPMCAPGVTCGGGNFVTPEGNHFGGPLSGALPGNLGGQLDGNAIGSFVNNGPTVAAGVIGNFNAHNDLYGVTGVFGGRR